MNQSFPQKNRRRPAPAPSSSRQNRRAFSLLELLIAVTVMALLATVMIPLMRSSETQTLESIARVLAADLRLARNLAVQYNTRWSVRFDVDKNAYEVVHTGSGNPPPLRNPSAPAGSKNSTYRVSLAGMGTSSRSTSGIRLANVELKDSRQTVDDVTFEPLGGTGPARNQDTRIRLVKDGVHNRRSIQLTVSWVTGQVWIDSPQIIQN